MPTVKLTIPRDFTFNKEAIISYWESLKEYDGKKITQSAIARILKDKNPDSDFYNALDRKFATLKFYGFVSFENRRLRINPNYENYVRCLNEQQGVISGFLDVLKSSKHKYYPNLNVNFFDLVIDLLQDKSILYVDLFDVLTYLVHYDKLDSLSELKRAVAYNHSLEFSEKIDFLENFYSTFDLGGIAAPLHEAKTYLFSFLEANGFCTARNSLQVKVYFQGETPRNLEDIRLYLSEELLVLVNGFDNESILDEVTYNLDLEDGYYDESSLEDIKLVEPSQETKKSISRRYETDKKLRNTALKKSSYTCELAIMKTEQHMTFVSRTIDEDYAEVHHLIPMHAQEDDSFVLGSQLISLDQLPNLIVLCPTCHRKIHYGKNIDVKLDLELLFEGRLEDLKRRSLNISKEQLLSFYKITN